MKIAILSDIHGNMLALNAVLADVEKNKCEKILFLGDYVLAGPEPAATADYCMHLKDDKDIEMIKGNTDKMIVEYSEELRENLSETAPIMSEALRDDYNILTAEQKEFLEGLPEQKTVEYEGVKILMVHGSPRAIDENIFPDTPSNEVNEMVKDLEATIIVCGHTHIPCGFQTVTKKTVINAGSVGRPFTERPDSCYLIIDLHDGKYQIEHRFVKYDKEKSSQILAGRNFDGAEQLAQMLINPTERHM